MNPSKVLGLSVFLLMSLSWAASPLEAPSAIRVPSKLAQNLKSFEPSSSVYLADLDRYLIASDDTTKKDDPWLFLMDENGNVEETPLIIKGIQKMTDIESISQDKNGTLFILGSQGLNKNGKDLTERNLFVRAERVGRKIKAVDVIELRPLLLKALLQSSEENILALRNQFEEQMDIESHFIFNGKLFLGFKEPQVKKGQAMIICLGSVDYLFNQQRIEKLSVSLDLKFSSLSKHADLLSEMLKIGNTLLMTTTSEDSIGRLWSYNLQSQELKILRNYKKLRPEGLAYNPKQGELLVFFDQGEEAALFQIEKVQKPSK